MPVGVLLSVMSSHELAEWRAYFALEAEDRERERLAATVNERAEAQPWRA